MVAKRLSQIDSVRYSLILKSVNSTTHLLQRCCAKVWKYVPFSESRNSVVQVSHWLPSRQALTSEEGGYNSYITFEQDCLLVVDPKANTFPVFIQRRPYLWGQWTYWDSEFQQRPSHQFRATTSWYLTLPSRDSYSFSVRLLLQLNVPADSSWQIWVSVPT